MIADRSTGSGPVSKPAQQALPDLHAMMAALIAQRSISSARADLDCSNRGVCELLAGWLEPLGFDCRLLPVPVAGGPDKVNLIARLAPPGGAPDAAGLVLAGHADTVPFDADGWHSDPFALRRVDDTLVGLGVCDMKGFLAIAAEVAAEFARAPLTAPITLLATANEETGMEGARALVQAQALRGGCAVIGEPTSLRPVHAHKGILMEAITLHGRAGHSSNPALGANTIQALPTVLSALNALQAELRAAHSNPLFSVQHPTLNPGHVCGGDSPNRIPARCELHIDLRFLPGMDYAELRQRVRSAVQNAVAQTDCTADFRPLFDGAPAYQIDATADLVQAASALSGLPPTVVDFATEAAFLGELGMETIVMGPGDICVAHQPDESLALDRIEPTRQVLRGLIRSHCLAA